MAGYLSVKMKRKDLEEVYDDFSDFSLSSPARKIRRLDAELPPIMEEEEHEIPLIYGHPMPTEQLPGSMEQIGASVTEGVPSVPYNEERALVLYKPVNSPLLQSSSSLGFSITLNSELFPGLKGQFHWPDYPNSSSVRKMVDDEAATSEQKSGQTPNNLAVVPWIPSSQVPSASTTMEVPETGISEPMEAEEMEGTTMEIEENSTSMTHGLPRESSAFGGSEGLQQWQQQHCLTPQLPENRSTPITWYR